MTKAGSGCDPLRYTIERPVSARPAFFMCGFALRPKLAGDPKRRKVGADIGKGRLEFRGVFGIVKLPIG